jgi:hypothetical protein
MRRSVFVLLLLASACTSKKHDRGDDLLLDRVWLDHEPKSERDVVQGFMAIPSLSGVFIAQNVWKGGFEVFRFKRRDDGALDVVFPDNGDKQRLTYTAWRCNEKQYDFCLELSGTNRGVRRYVSKKEWKRRRGEDDQAAVERVLSDAR